MMNIIREEILLVLKGFISQRFDKLRCKWLEPFTAVKIQILRIEEDFHLRISTDFPQKSDLVVFTATTNITAVKPLDNTLLQIHVRRDIHDVAILCLRFNSSQDKDHFFLLLKNVGEELKSRDTHLGQPSVMAAKSSTEPLVGPPLKEPQARGSDIENVIDLLMKAVANGDSTGASEAASSLSKKKVKLSINADEIGDIPGNRSKFILDVCVEDQHSSGTKLRLYDIIPNMTIGFLKKRVFQIYDFPVEVQRWIIGKRIVKDTETLMENRINSSTPVFLYLISAEKAGITKESVELSKQAMQQQQQMQYSPYPSPEVFLPEEPPVPPRRPPAAANRQFDARPVRGAPPQVPPKKPTAEEVGWHCPKCTLINPPSIPGCRACLEGRPDDYEVPSPDLYIMDRDEKVKRDELLRSENLMQQMEQQQRQNDQAARVTNYQCLLETDLVSLIPNATQFDCLICYSDVAVGEGVMLRECLHMFCKECLKEHILNNTEPVIMCPFNDMTYSCPEKLLDREIQALVSSDEFVMYLERGLSVAENQALNSFHCKIPDCRGFCFYDDNINFFKCPICDKENCLTCKAIHEGMNCKQYQDDLNRRSANDDAAKMTKIAIEKMVQKGEAMKCPQCGIIIIKKDGCDWVKCSMCKLEVCWVTKGPRWGPAGEGDISGGCKCRVQGRQCHPQCHNCH